MPQKSIKKFIEEKNLDGFMNFIDKLNPKELKRIESNCLAMILCEEMSEYKIRFFEIYCQKIKNNAFALTQAILIDQEEIYLFLWEKLNKKFSKENLLKLIERKSYEGQDVIKICCLAENSKFLKEMIDFGAKINTPSTYSDKRALDIAIEKDNQACIDLLLEHPLIELNVINSSTGNGFLHQAIINCDQALIEKLLKKDIDLYLENNKKENALKLAIDVYDYYKTPLYEKNIETLIEKMIIQRPQKESLNEINHLLSQYSSEKMRDFAQSFYEKLNFHQELEKKLSLPLDKISKKIKV